MANTQVTGLTALATEEAKGPWPPRKRPTFLVWRWVVLLLAAAFFLIPLWAALRFAGISAFGSVIGFAGFASSLGLSLKLAIITTLITIALMLPTAIYVHLRLPTVRRLLEGITILPIVIPPVVLIVGVLARLRPASSRARICCSRWITWYWPCRSPTDPLTPGCARWT